MLGQCDPYTYYEIHHIIPRSQRGTDHPSNLVKLTVREHMLSHILLYKMGDAQQIFSVECFLKDAININKPNRFGQVRYKKWHRKAIGLQRAENNRKSGIALQKRIYQHGMTQVTQDYVDGYFKAKLTVKYKSAGVTSFFTAFAILVLLIRRPTIAYTSPRNLSPPTLATSYANGVKTTAANY